MTDRGARTREQMEQAGVELLTESGWPAVTSRAISERSGANVGLIHYHYGGLPALHRAIAARAVGQSIRPLIEDMINASDVRLGLAGLINAVAEQDRILALGRLVSELIVGSFRDQEIKSFVRDELRRVRDLVADWIRSSDPSIDEARAQGIAILITGLIDGLVVHRLMDSDLDLRQAARGVRHTPRQDGCSSAPIP